ncbi:MAG: YwiC-like family protein [Candidatus Nanopelagicales bacterium]|nr:YwiC-like family protein [Candidatus Nanopelagicales bacterium]MDZ4249525.1 YwiC-like family protein [Candidatus Nanopelagicales bacterium]
MTGIEGAVDRIEHERHRLARRAKQWIPPQHGAWAFLAVPLVMGFGLAGFSARGGLFAIAWVAAYPCGYFAGRAVRAWLRRRKSLLAGYPSSLAKRESRVAAGWAVPIAICGLPLVAIEPWLIGVLVLMAGLWAVNVRLAWLGMERSLGNDLVLVAEAVIAVPLFWMVTSGDPILAAVPGRVWLAAGVCAVYFAGSVVHVKSLIRKRRDDRWRTADVAYHGVAAVVMTLVSVWLVVPFGAALARSVALRPGERPAVIGSVEIGVSVLVVVFGLLATRWGVGLWT